MLGRVIGMYAVGGDAFSDWFKYRSVTDILERPTARLASESQPRRTAWQLRLMGVGRSRKGKRVLVPVADRDVRAL